MIDDKYKNAAIEICKDKGAFSCEVGGECMKDILPRGTKIVVNTVGDVGKLRCGDIVVVAHNELLITHRYLGRMRLDGEEYLMCKGDSYRRPDPLWHHSKLLGIFSKKSAEDIEVDIDIPVMTRIISRLQFFFFYLLILFQINRCRVFVERMNASFEIETSLAYEKHLLMNCLVDKLPVPSGKFLNTCKIIICGVNDKPAILTDASPEYSTDKLKVYAVSEQQIYIVKEDSVSIINALETAFRMYAVNFAVENGGLCIHASCVKSGEEAYMFAGISGTGKTTCKNKFPVKDRLDDDMVVLIRKENGFARINWSPFSFKNQDIYVRKVFIPVKADTFVLKEILCREAMKYIFNLPPEGCSEIYKEAFFDASCKLGESVKIYFVEWEKNSDLRQLIADAL